MFLLTKKINKIIEVYITNKNTSDFDKSNANSELSPPKFINFLLLIDHNGLYDSLLLFL